MYIFELHEHEGKEIGEGTGEGKIYEYEKRIT